MPKRLKIEPHLTIEELKARFRQAKNPIEARHCQVLWLLAEGRATSEVAQITGYSQNWIYEFLSDYNRVGPESLGDRRCQNSDEDPLLNDVQQALLWQALQETPPDGGLWNGRKVADWMSALLGRRVHRQRGWEYLKSMRFRLRVPRPEHEGTDPVEQEEWKKKYLMR